MSDTKKAISTWEKERNMLVTTVSDPSKKLTEAEFLELILDENGIPKPEVTGVNHDDRIKFLKANDYEVNRQNMVDPELSTRPAEEQK